MSTSSTFRLPSAVSSFSQQVQHLGHAVAHGKFGGGTDSRYFTTTKKGEIHELKEELHSQNKEKRKDAVKKVIAAMTVGKDVSGLFPDVVSCMQTTNVELKKLVYLYVINYAKAQPELAILAVNTFRRDSHDANPLIRALAIRTMGCIRLEQVVEYIVEPLRRACKDSDPYVRKTAAIGIAKLYDTSPQTVTEQGFLDTLREMLGDANPMVVANSVAALSEISETSGGKKVLKLNETTVNKLLAALNECTEWGQVFILDALATYNPTSPKEIDSIIERVAARLSHANAAVVLSAVKVVMRLLDKTQNLELAEQMKKKLGPPLITLLSAEPELQFVALRNISLIIQKRTDIFSGDVKVFFCKYNDPAYVKVAKLEIIVRLCSDKNVEVVLSELKEYASEVDVDFVRKTVRAIGRVAVKLEKSAEVCVRVLLELVESRVNYVVQEAVVVIKDVFRKYPNQYENIIGVLCENLESLDEPEAKASMIWILGHYAERIDNPQTLLTSFVAGFHDEPSNVQLQFLTAVVKLFLKSPQNSQQLVTKVLKMATEESDNPDLRDRGYIYWRLLSSNPEAARRIILADLPAISSTAFSLPAPLLDILIDNISMLASVYHKPPEAFVTHLRAISTYEEELSDSDGEEKLSPEAIREELGRAEYDSGSDGEKSVSRMSSSSSSGGPSDLLARDFSSPTSPKPVVVLSPETPGSRGQVGVGVLSAITREAGEIKCRLIISNRSSTVLTNWAIQFNKNSFGLAPTDGLSLGPLSPGESTDVCLSLSDGRLVSPAPPPDPLFLQAAVKCSLDIFYFNLPFTFDVVLREREPLDRDTYRSHWQRMGDTKQSMLMAVTDQPTVTSWMISRLQGVNIFFVAQRTQDAFDSVYFSAVTTNNLLLLIEVAIQKGGVCLRFGVRTDAVALVPVTTSLLLNTLAARRVSSNTN